MSLAEIAEDEDLEVGAVKAALMQCSPKFRNESKTVVDLQFSEDDQLVAKQIIAELASNSEDENVKLRAAKYIRDDSKGRLDLGSKNAPRINVLVFNEALERAARQMRAARGFRAEPTKVIELSK